MSISRSRIIGLNGVKLSIIFVLLLAWVMASNKAVASNTILAPKADDIIEGNPKAKLQMVIYYSPSCHHCHEYFNSVMPAIRERYIKTGKMCAINREVIGSRQDYIASLIARCRQDKARYVSFTSQLLKEGTSWAYNKNYEDILQNIAFDAGISREECRACLKNKELQTMVLSNTQAVANLPDFIGVPSIYINGKLYEDALDKAKLCHLIDGCLSKM